MVNPIVVVNVSVTNPPAPNTLQGSGAFISQGATTLAEGTTALLQQMTDLTSILTGAEALTSLSWASSVVTATTAAPHGFTISDTVELTIAGATPAGYNGTFPCTITGASTFTYPEVTTLASASVPGTYTPEDVAELVAMATTFFAQGSNTAVSVLELGEGTAAEGVTALTTFMNGNKNAFYAYLVPRDWAAESTFATYAGTFTADTAKQYFWVTTSTSNYTAFVPLKSVMCWVEAPGIPATEFSAAADFYVTLNYRPSSTNKVPPNSFAFLVGVTPYPTAGSANQTTLTTLQNAGVNVVGTGAEGDLSNSLVAYGTFMDKTPFNVWYSIDWMQINLDLNIANEVINGSNSTANPLYYDQPGINRLQVRAAATISQGISFGLSVGQLIQAQLDQATFIENFNDGDYSGVAALNAVPFGIYVNENPNDYPQGLYGGLTAIYTPQRGFRQIIFNLNAVNFA